MADFLASFNFGASTEIAPDDGACNSLDEFQQRLRKSIEPKTTATRAERIITTLDLAGQAQFTVKLTAAHNVDPLLTDGEPTGTSDGAEAQVLVYRASDVLKSQLNEGRRVQEAVAEQIVAAAGSVDESTWLLHDYKSVANGCQLTFLCAKSTQAWTQQNKGKPRSVVGDFSVKEADPINMSRPAFDCKGCICIIMSGKNRTISVQYDHTPLHQTVADYAEFCKPPPMIGPQKPDKKTMQLALKKAQDDAASIAKAERRAKRKAEREANGKTPKKKKKKNKNDDNADNGEDDQMSSLVDQASQALATVGAMQPGSGDATNGEGAIRHSGVDGSEPSRATAGPTALNLNVTPEEATRRKEVALKMLRDAGVNHETLTAEQLNIFANQSPELQRDSLNMLVNYGAERLQVIHPSNRDSSASTPVPGAARSTPPATTTKQLALEVETSRSKTKGSKKSRPPGKSRLSCLQCKSRKVKCPKERPTCMECQSSNTSCEYPPQPPRKRKSKSNGAASVTVDAHVDVDEDADADEDGEGGRAEAEAEGLGEPGDEDGENEEDDGDCRQGAEENIENPADETTVMDVRNSVSPNLSRQDIPQTPADYQQYQAGQFSYPQLPAADGSSASRDQPFNHAGEQASQLPYYQTASGLSLPQSDPLDDPQRPSLATGLALPENTVYYPPFSPPAPAATSPSALEPMPERQHEVAAQTFRQHKGRSSTGSRRKTTMSPAWAASSNEAAAGSAANASPSLRHTLPESQNPDPALMATAHGVQMQDVQLLAHAAASRRPQQQQQQQQPQLQHQHQQYTPNSSARIQRPSTFAPGHSSFQPAYSPQSKSQQGHRASNTTPQNSNNSPFRLPSGTLRANVSNSSNTNHDYNNSYNSSKGNSVSGNINRYDYTNNAVANQRSMSGQTAAGLGGGGPDMPAKSSDNIRYEPYVYQKSAQSNIYQPLHFGATPTDNIAVGDNPQQSTMAQTAPPYLNPQHLSSDGHSRPSQTQHHGWQGPGAHESDGFSRGQQRGYGWRGMQSGWNNGH